MNFPGVVASVLALVAVGMAPLTASAVAPTQGQPEVQEAMDTVERQLEAFRQDDYAAAYTHASAEIQALFDLPAFERMVRTGYPEIARSARAWLAEPTPLHDGRLLLRVRVQGESGRSIDAVYEMVREDGRWRINGVLARPASDAVA